MHISITINAVPSMMIVRDDLDPVNESIHILVLHEQTNNTSINQVLRF